MNFQTWKFWIKSELLVHLLIKDKEYLKKKLILKRRAVFMEKVDIDFILDRHKYFHRIEALIKACLT